MKRYFTGGIFLSALVFLSCSLAVAATTVPSTLNYQGTLTDNAGQSVTGTKQIIFNLYSVASGGAAFWTETQNVMVTNGQFSVVLGSNPGNPLDTTKFAGETYVGITIGTAPEMAPRQKFTSVAYAFKAGDAGATVPSGGIIMWSGSVAKIPAGWALCDGANGTPNLRNRFIAGAGSDYAVGATGGEAVHALTTDEMPSHTHIQNAHNHSGAGGNFSVNAGSFYGLATGTGYTTGNSTATNQNTGGGIAHENRPPYYALAFIMKL